VASPRAAGLIFAHKPVKAVPRCQGFRGPRVRLTFFLVTGDSHTLLLPLSGQGVSSLRHPYPEGRRSGATGGPGAKQLAKQFRRERPQREGAAAPAPTAVDTAPPPPPATKCPPPFPPE